MSWYLIVQLENAFTLIPRPASLLSQNVYGIKTVQYAEVHDWHSVTILTNDVRRREPILDETGQVEIGLAIPRAPYK